ncbi:MAG: tRNA uridine-5-carboxymethylaminomethyl(34) synthesis GTPase MnmE [Polaromonas sp.]|nr:tRNA uridine-5-carboxymethylaminomethyl(34) synthesis GTPase MnmE [Polaromonas sp.]
MFSRQQDPIVAIATAPGRGAVGIVRVSGKGLGPLVQALLGRALRPREATYLPFRGGDGFAIDHGLALYFPAPHSFTGEDVLELQAHGGPVVLQLLMARCLEVAAQLAAGTAAPLLPGLRVAQPGEFSQRAFLNDKLDLAQAEAIADLIDASTEAAVKSASRSLSGEFSRDIHTLRDALIHLRMLVEATLDFPEEEIDFLRKADAAGQLQNLKDQLAVVRQRARQGALLREGIRVVIAGQPNAGKSSLLNALAGAELAIVTPIAGTTRDKVEQTIQIEGVPLHVVDTAGLREGADEVEQIGIARAWEAIHAADAVLMLHDLTRCDDPEYIAADADIASVMGQKDHQIHLWNKCDVCPPDALRHVAEGDLAISAKAGLGLNDLRQRLLQAVGWQAAPEGLYMARERHVRALAVVGDHLDVAAGWLGHRAEHLDLLAEELRLAQGALGEITGEFSADDLLGEIFSRFCIGK